MTTRLMKKCASCTVARHTGGCLFGCNQKERLSRELDILMREVAPQSDSMEEQLEQCPEAFKAGELIEKMFGGSRRERSGTASGSMPSLHHWACSRAST